jgi:hypothetical protein
MSVIKGSTGTVVAPRSTGITVIGGKSESERGLLLAAEERESRFRLLAGTAILLMLFTAAFGLAWDIRWHVVVGRDTFFTPPHMLLYGGIAIAGLVSLGVVLADTWRYYTGAPAVNDRTTTRVLGVFHAPLGFVVAGFGLLTLLLAAPLDNYWHELYGIDVALWTPFHMMGMVGGFIAGLGVVYIFASEAARARSQGRYRFRLWGLTGTEWGVLVAMAMLVGHLMVAAMPASNQFPTTLIGPLELLTYPLLLALFLPAIGVASVVVTRRPGAATLVFAVFFLRQVAFSIMVPWAVWWLIGGDVSQLRVPGWRPGVNPVELMFTALLVGLPMLVIDLAAAYVCRRKQARLQTPAHAQAQAQAQAQAHSEQEERNGTGPGWLLTVGWACAAGTASAVPLLIIASVAVTALIAGARQLALPASIIIGNVPHAQAALEAVPATLVAGALSALTGLGWGSFLRVYDR